jgi:hypothetical protein
MALFDHFSLCTVYFLQKTIESVALRIYLHIGSIYRTCTYIDHSLSLGRSKSGSQGSSQSP